MGREDSAQGDDEGCDERDGRLMEHGNANLVIRTGGRRDWGAAILSGVTAEPDAAGVADASAVG